MIHMRALTLLLFVSPLSLLELCHAWSSALLPSMAMSPKRAMTVS